jgi:hypothetical protein
MGYNKLGEIKQHDAIRFAFIHLYKFSCGFVVVAWCFRESAERKRYHPSTSLTIHAPYNGGVTCNFSLNSSL